MSAPDPRAWRVAIALAHECGLDWARWARSRFANPNCDECCGRGGRRDDDVPDQWYPCECLRDIPAPWDTAAYLADCARRGVEQGPLPSLEWTAPDGFGWKVCPSEGGSPYVEFTWCGDAIAGWGARLDMIEFYTDEDGRARVEYARELVARIVTLATAAAKAMVP